MFVRIDKKSFYRIFIFTVALSGVVTTAHAQTTPDMSEQLIKMGGAMHVTAQVCGGYSEAQLAESKQKQQAMLEQRGVDSANFEKIYSAAMKQAEQKWQALSKAEQETACEEFKHLAAKMIQ